MAPCRKGPSQILFSFLYRFEETYALLRIVQTIFLEPFFFFKYSCSTVRELNI